MQESQRLLSHARTTLVRFDSAAAALYVAPTPAAGTLA